MGKFRKKPVVVEAHRWMKNGDHPEDMEADESPDIVEGEVVRRFSHVLFTDRHICTCGMAMRDHGWIDTLEGGHKVCPGDWIITGVEGERYPCKPHIFDQTYESVEVAQLNASEITIRADQLYPGMIVRIEGKAARTVTGAEPHKLITDATWVKFEDSAPEGEAQWHSTEFNIVGSPWSIRGVDLCEGMVISYCGELRTINSCATAEPNNKIRIVKFEDDTVRYQIHFDHFVALVYDPNHVARGLE